MALMPLSPQFPGMAGLQNLLRDHTSPELLPSNARGTPPPNAVPSGRALPAGGGDVLELTGGGGGQAVSGAGLYQLQASGLSLSAQSLNISLGSGSGSGRGALGVLNGALGASPAGSGGAMAKLREALEELGLGDESVRDLLMLAALLEKLDPEALEKFVRGMTEAARSMRAPAAGEAGATAAPAPAGGGGSFQLNYVSVSISVTEVEASVAQSGGGEVAQLSARRFEVRFERLEISMGAPLQEGDPLVLDVEGDGLDLRETSEGVLFDLTGSGRVVRTAFVQGDDALLFYDANMNGLLDGGAELVGNRVEGLNGFEELARMDENGDGRVSAADPAWEFLRLFQDENGDGRASPLEVALLEEAGLTELSALWEREEGVDGEGLRRAGSGSFTREDGTRGLMLDYYFGYRPA